MIEDLKTRFRGFYNFQAAHDQPELAPAFYDEAQLEEKLRSPEWQNLRPNISTPEDLIPSDLSAESLKHLIAKLASLELNSQTGQPDKLTDTELSGIGKIQEIGRGEAKVCYLFTDTNGKKIVILAGGYDDRQGITIPSDPNLTTINQHPGYRLSEYSDLRTYMRIPIDENRGVILQEYGGEEVKSSGSFLPGGLMWARRRVKRAIRRIPDQTAHSLERADQEISHLRHCLRKSNGSLVITDVPIEQSY